jgi:chorismate mutase/prephenate dehydratase
MDLSSYRERIDAIDHELLRLFKERMSIAGEIGRYKAAHHLPILNQTREREILQRVSKEAGEDLSSHARILFGMLFELSRAYQLRLQPQPSDLDLAQRIHTALSSTPPIFPRTGSVACQGIEGAYSQLACEKVFPHGDITYFRSFDAVFQAVEQGLCQYGILPIENSSYGTVNAVYDLMRNHHFHIVRSIKLQVNHVLLGKRGTKLSGLKEVFSHDQAIGQCSEFFKQRKDLKVTLCENTAVAAQKVADSPQRELAAISSRACAELYGLDILSDKIQNSDYNYTRFIVISKQLAIYPGANRISIMLSLPHKPGALYRLLAKFAVLGVNLLKLESRPIAGRDFDFMFYFDFEASLHEPDVVQLLANLAAGPELFVFLGSYSE